MDIATSRDPRRTGFRPVSLDALNFLLADVRGALGLSDNTTWLIGVQLLDGVGAGIFGAITPLVIADLMRGTGRYNVAQGTVATAQGIGASLSGLAVGVIVDRVGYSAAFIECGAAAAMAFAALALAMPETAPSPAPAAAGAARGTLDQDHREAGEQDHGRERRR